MKKFILIVLAMLMVLGTVVGCAQKEVKVDVSALADTLKSELSFTDVLMELKKEKMLDFYRIDGEKVADFKLYVSETSGTAEEIAVFEAKENADVAEIEAAVKKRIEDQKLGFDGYNDAELVKLDDALVKTQGKYVIFVVSGDKENAVKLVDEAFKK